MFKIKKKNNKIILIESSKGTISEYGPFTMLSITYVTYTSDEGFNIKMAMSFGEFLKEQLKLEKKKKEIKIELEKAKNSKKVIDSVSAICEKITNDNVRSLLTLLENEIEINI